MTASPGRVVEAVRAELQRRGVSQAKAAAHLGISQQSVSHRLCGRTPLTVNQLIALADLLEVPVVSLLEPVVSRLEVDDPHLVSRVLHQHPTAQAVPA